MGALVIEQVACAVRALVDRDPVLAQAVLARESRVDQYEKQLDRDSLTFIALQQPVANDLRLARAIVRIGRELERAGDEAKKIARFAIVARQGERRGPGPRGCATVAAHVCAVRFHAAQRGARRR